VAGAAGPALLQIRHASLSLGTPGIDCYIIKHPSLTSAARYRPADIFRMTDAPE